jgi:hypothetical protein
MRRTIVAVFVALVSVSNVRAFDVTECYQSVPAGEVGVLRNTIGCDGGGGPNVTVGRGATLLLNNYTISGGYIGVATDPGGARAKIIGPGIIIGASGDPFGCGIAPSGKVFIKDVILHDNHRGIVNIYDFAMKLEHVTIANNDAEGITSYFGSMGNGIGPGNGQITGRDLIVTGNGGDGVVGFGKLDLQGGTVSDNVGAGIRSRGRTFSLRGIAVNRNGETGMVSTSAKPGRIKDATLTANGSGGDVAAPVPPKLRASTCEHSVDLDSGGTLGICSGD